jgi:hypothetical protein
VVRHAACVHARIRAKSTMLHAVSVDTLRARADSVMRVHVLTCDSRRGDFRFEASRARRSKTMRAREGRSMDRRQDGIGVRHIAPQTAVIGTPRLRCSAATAAAATRHAVPAPLAHPLLRARTATHRPPRATGSARSHCRTTGPAAVRADRHPRRGCDGPARPSMERARRSCQ